MNGVWAIEREYTEEWGKNENENDDDEKCSDERGLVINNRWKNSVGTKE